MKVNQHPHYDASFPETFNWSLIDSISLTPVAEQLAKRINGDKILITEQRHATPGCRYALNLIAEIADL